MKRFADIAQVAERILGKDEAMGSSPVIGSRTRRCRPAAGPQIVDLVCAGSTPVISAKTRMGRPIQPSPACSRGPGMPIPKSHGRKNPRSFFWRIAQTVEPSTDNREVPGSTPGTPTNFGTRPLIGLGHRPFKSGNTGIVGRMAYSSPVGCANFAIFSPEAKW